MTRDFQRNRQTLKLERDIAGGLEKLLQEVGSVK